MENYRLPNKNKRSNNFFLGNHPDFNMNTHNFKKSYETRQLKKKSNSLGFFVFSYALVLQALATILYILLAMCGVPFSEFLSSVSIPSSLLYIFVAVFAALVPGIFYFLFSGSKISDVISVKRVKPNVLLPLVCIGMAVAMIANVASNITTDNLSLFGLEYYGSSTETYDTSNLALSSFLSIIATAVVPALAEEFAYRGILMGSLRKYGDSFAIIASSVIFGAMHGNILQIPFAFIIGLVLAYADCKTDSIIPSIIIHFLNNLFSVIISILMSASAMSERKIAVISYIVMAAFCLLGIISFICLIRNDKGFFKTDNKANVKPNFAESLTLKEKNLAFFLSPGIILALSLFLFETIYTLTVFQELIGNG